jgi:hypothetical protein
MAQIPVAILFAASLGSALLGLNEGSFHFFLVKKREKEKKKKRRNRFGFFVDFSSFTANILHVLLNQFSTIYYLMKVV